MSERSREAETAPVSATSVLPYIPGLRRYALSLCGNLSDADDLVQESISRAMARQRKNSDIRNLRAYLFAVLYNAHIDHLSEERRWQRDLAEDFPENLQSTPASQSDRLELGELAEALKQLPEEQRETLLLVGYEGLTYKESAAVLGVPIGTIMSRLSRARATLRRLTDRPPPSQSSDRRRRQSRQDKPGRRKERKSRARRR